MRKILVVLTVVATITGCSKSNSNTPAVSSIVGSWTYDGQAVTDDVTLFKFTKEGRYYTTVKGGGGIDEEDKGQYKYDGKKLYTSFIDDGVLSKDTITCTVSGNTLTIGSSKAYTRQN